jgi:hypothetical protein
VPALTTADLSAACLSADPKTWLARVNLPRRPYSAARRPEVWTCAAGQFQGGFHQLTIDHLVRSTQDGAQGLERLKAREDVAQQTEERRQRTK